MYGIVDCNNFFASCERVFRPDLDGKPVVVLSNNDGCIVARSNEAKQMGIPMGLPFFRLSEYDPLGKVAYFSSNYVLYADLSRRVMSIVADTFPELTPYSIDESFFYTDMASKELEAKAGALPSLIKRCTGIPVCVGVAPTKTLAKMACRFAKKHKAFNSFCMIDDDVRREKALSLIEVGDVWGIGRRNVDKLRKAGIVTALDFCRTSEQQVRKLMGITGVRTWRELRGEDSIDIEASETKSSITTSRSFAQMVTELEQMRSLVANFATMCAAKLRNQKSAASIVSVYILTNRFRDDLPQQNNIQSVSLNVPASSQMEIVKAADMALRQIFVRGMAYKKAGVLLSGIVPDKRIQLSLFDQDQERRERMDRLSAVVDNINKTEGMNAVHLASQMSGKANEEHGAQGVFLNNLRREHISPRYTTSWSEIMKVH